jgi:hypothetical protein
VPRAPRLPLPPCCGSIPPALTANAPRRRAPGTMSCSRHSRLASSYGASMTMLIGKARRNPAAIGSSPIKAPMIGSGAVTRRVDRIAEPLTAITASGRADPTMPALLPWSEARLIDEIRSFCTGYEQRPSLGQKPPRSSTLFPCGW